MRLIDADALAEEYKATDANPSAKLYPWSLQDILQIMDEQPTVEVVRCKNCKHWNVHPINGKLSLGKCAKLSRVMGDTYFCSYGERRDYNAVD